MNAIDRIRILDLCDSDAAEVLDLLTLTAEVVQTLLIRVASAIEQSDLAGALSAMHELRGSAANVGAPEIAALAGAFEESLRTNGVVCSPNDDLAELHAACDRLVAATMEFQV